MDDYVVVSRYAVTIPEILPPPSDGLGHRVNVYNTGDAVDTMDSIPQAPCCMCNARAPPCLILCDPLLDCQEDQLPRPEEAPALAYLALGREYEQHVVDLQYGPVSPQIACYRDSGLGASSLVSEGAQWCFWSHFSLWACGPEVHGLQAYG